MMNMGLQLSRNSLVKAVKMFEVLPWLPLRALAGMLLLGLVAACTPQPVDPAAPDDMVLVPAGWFLMGQDDGPRSSRPQRRVYLDAFRIDRTEVTVADFDVFVRETGFLLAREWEAAIPPELGDWPVTGVVWAEADAYCRWAGKRLPSEAEWEKAARGTDGRIYPWGNRWNPTRANTAESERGRPLAVGSFSDGASPYGALDMAGNVTEWVADSFAFDYYTHAPAQNPTGPDGVLDHGLRGGSWASPREQAQTFFRDSSHSVKPNDRVGFRCAQTGSG